MSVRSMNLDIPRLINLALSNGAVTEAEVKDAILESRKATVRNADGKVVAGSLPISQHCAHGRDAHGHLYSMFLATKKKEDGGGLLKSEDGKRVKFNIRSSSAPKRQEAQRTMGEALPQTQGAPDASAVAAAVLAALQQGQTQQAPAQQQESVQVEPEGYIDLEF